MLKLRTLPETTSVQTDGLLGSKTGLELDDIQGQPVTCLVDELHPHPSYVRHHLTVPAAKLSALAERGDLVFQEPLAITRDRTIIDGYGRWELARRKGRATLPCLEYDLSAEDALRWLLHRHCRSNGLNDFGRILLALELEPCFREKTRSNQRAGGEQKGSSNLTEAERLDVRREIATAAGVSVGNVTKVKQLIINALSDVLRALRSGEIRIHRAWLWSKESPENQIEALKEYRKTTGIKKTIRKLLIAHRQTATQSVCDAADLGRRLIALHPSKLAELSVTVVKASGRIVFLTEELYRDLALQEELR